MIKINNRNTRKRCKICLKITIKIPQRCNDVVLVFLLLTLNTFDIFSSVSIVDFEQVLCDNDFDNL